MNIQEANEIVQEWINEGDDGKQLYLDGLTSAVGLTLPTNVRDLSLDGLTSAEGLALPESVGGDLSLDGLTSAVGLTLPISIRETVWLRDLPLADNVALRNRYPNLAHKIK